MDLTMLPADGVEATRRMSEKRRRTRVVIFTMRAVGAYLTPVINAGAAGYVLKDKAETELANVVRAVAHGDCYVSTHASTSLARHRAPKRALEQAAERFTSLSPRERAILVLVAQGFSGPEIAAELTINVKTVDTLCA